MVAPALEDLKIASHVTVFDGLKPNVVSRLLAPATVLTLKHGDCLYRQGDLAASLYIVIAGWMKLYRITLSGDEAIIHVVTKGESLPEAAALTSARYAATPRQSVRFVFCKFLLTISCAAFVKRPTSRLP
jgi:CRP-like cAMP-binding protein